MTMAVPPLLKTEFSSVPRVTFGATVLAWALPSAATISAKSGISPAGAPILMPSCAWPPPKCGPADLKSGASHLATAVRVAVPTLWPCAFLISTVTGLAACARVSCTTTRLAADKSSAAHVRDFIIRSPRRDGSPEFGFTQKNCHPNLAHTAEDATTYL